MNREFFLKNLWLWKCEKPENISESKLNLSEIGKDQWNEKFEILRKNRMILGFFRYGKIKGNKKKYANIDSAILRLQKYQETGNSEFLVDASNLCMIEFTQENHPKFHFDSIDDGIHTQTIKN